MVAKRVFGATLLSLVLFIQAGNAQCPTAFENFTYTSAVSWNTSAWSSHQYKRPGDPNSAYMRFRMMTPNGFNRCAVDGLKYPLIVFLHGSGESGAYDANVNDGVGEQNNDLQLAHGGQKHRDAVLNNTFPGFVIFPQIRRDQNNQNYWGPGNLDAVKYIIDKLVADYKVDPDRIYFHGLSMGGEGTWIFMSRHPKVVAAAHPMSAAGSSFWGATDLEKYKFIPLRSAQGALDNAPSKDQGNEQIQKIRGVGGSIRYSYYPTLGHGTWNDEYNKSDFFSWFLSKRKNQIAALGERTTFCPGENFTVVLGVTPGFTNYQWTKDNTSNPPFATTNTVTITQAVSASSGEGTYYVRYQRDNGTMTDWSAGVVISRTQGPSATPAIATNGQSLNLPSLDGSPEVILYGSTNKATYEWSRDAGILAGLTTSNITVNVGGTYTLKAKDPAGTGFQADNVTPTEFRANPQGCLSAASAPVIITTQNGLGSPAPPTNFFASATSLTSVTINWDDRSSNETGFELYRSLSENSGYDLITILPATATANPQSYVDNGLQANTTYYYRMRAVNTSGGSAYTPVAQVTTALDNDAPTAPVLVVGATSRSEINLSWSGSTDAVGVFEYDIYQNGVMVNTTTSTTYKAINLVAFSTYTFVVKARDVAGNVSPPSNQVTPAAVNTGLFYTYYHHPSNLSSVDQLATTGTVIKTGYIAQFRLDPRTRNDGFGFMYEGYINIPTTGNYTFFTSSDDGSKLFVNNVLVVNNDGTHGCNERASSTINLSAGTYPIKALMFENGGGECLTVRWQGPGISKNEIPSSALRDNFTPPTELTTPNQFNASSASFSQINLTWNDRSNNETGFEISRSTSSNGTYQVIAITAANATSYQSTGLNPGTWYYYKIRAISANNASALVGPASAQTSSAPNSPSAPSSLVATPASATQVNLSWNDNSSVETGYEIQRSSSSTTGFVTFVTTAANVTSYVDTQVSGHSTIYYRARAIRTGATPSSYSNVASATTPNRAPTIADVPNQTIFAGTQATIQITVTDADNDPINFNFTGLPAQATFQSNSYGIGTLTFPATVPAGTYNITAQATDGITQVSDAFTVTVGSNHSPLVDVTVPTNFTGSLTTEEGRTAQIVIRVSEALDGNTVADPRPSLPPLPVFIDAPTWSWNNSTKIGLLTFNITPEVGEAGVREIPVTFSDGVGGITTYTFTVTVLQLDPFFTVSLNLVNSTVDANNNYNPANYLEQTPWNNISQSQLLTNLIDDQRNMVRFVAAQPTGWTDGNPRSVDLPASPTAVYTEKVRESFLKRASTGTNAQVVFTNLNTKMLYKVTVFGSGPAGAASSTRYLLTNGVSNTPKVVISNANNTSVTKTTDFLSAASNGTLTLRMLVDDAAGVTPGMMYLNAVILTGFYDNGSPPDAPSDVTLVAPVHNTVNIKWKDNSFNEDRFEVLRSMNAGGPWTVLASRPENDTLFVDNTVVGRTTYFYKIRAFNGTESTDSEVKLITTPNGLPVLAPLPTIVLQSGQIYQHNISATDPENDPLTLTALNLPLFATLIDNGDGTGFIRFIPTASDIGSYNFTVQATDNFSGRGETGGSLVIQDAQYEEVVFINFTGSGTTSHASAPWNNLGSLQNNTDLLNSTGASSPIDLFVGAGWNTSANTGGVNTGTNAGIYPDRILQSYWETTQTDPNVGALITLDGLESTRRYNIELFGSRNQFWFGNVIYVVTGTTTATKTLNISKNATRSVKFSGITPNAQGEITIRVKRAIAENASPLVEHLPATINAMIIETAIPGANPIKPSNVRAEAISKSAIRLSWTDNSSDETGFEIYRATSQGGPYTLIQTTAENVETFTNTGLAQNTPYIYRIRAVKSGGASVYTNDVYASTYDQIILVNVNSSPGSGQLQASAPWNNLATPPSAGLNFNALRNDLNVATTVGLQMLNWANGFTNNTGYLTGDNSGVYPDAVLEAYYYYEQSDPAINHKLTGLAANRAYDFVFMGSEWSTIATMAGHVVATDYSVGTETVSQFNGKNTKETVSIKNVLPDQANEIDFQVKQNDAARYGVWNSLEIRSYTPISAVFDQLPPSVPQDLAAIDTTDVTVDLEWSASTDNTGVAGYEVFQGSTLVATVTTTTAQVTGLQPLTVYTFTVRAFDVKGNRSPFATPIQVTTKPSSSTTIFYYSKSSGDISLATTWGRNTNGSGASPANFITNNQHFVLTRDAAVTSTFNITGTNSKLIVDDTRNLTINASLNAIIDLNANAKAIVNTATVPTFGTLDPTSTVTFNIISNAVPGAIYGNLELEGTNSTKSLSSGTYTVNGDLTVGSGITLLGAFGNSTTIDLSGDLIFEGSAVLNTADQLIDLRLNSEGIQTIIAPQTDITLFQLHIGDSTQLNISSAAARTITLGAAAKGGLVLDSGAVFNLGKHHLIIEGAGAINESNNGAGAISTSKGSITINSSEQVSNLYFKAGADTIRNFMLNSSPGQVHVRTKMNILQKLDVNNGAINSNGNIVLLSDASGSAWIGPIRNTGSVNGHIEFQRYFDAKGRVYRYVSTPLHGTTVADWMQYFQMTGPFTGSNNKNTTNSVFYYDDYEGWVPFPSETSAEVFVLGRGYSLFTFAGASPRKLRINGPIQQGDFDFEELREGTPDAGEGQGTTSPGYGWNLLGNPYAAPIEWGTAAWQSTDIDETVYVRSNEVVNGSVQFTYKQWNGEVGDTDFGGIIAQGQSFWVKANGSNPSLTITEEAKYDTASAKLYRKASPHNYIVVAMRKGSLTDKAYIHFREGSLDGADSRDAYKLDNSYFNVGSVAEHGRMAINSLPADFCQRNVNLAIGASSPGSYAIDFSQVNSFNSPVQITLIDHYNDTQTPISEGTTYTFDITTDASSAGESRFELLFSRPALDENVSFSNHTETVCGDNGLVVVLNNTQQDVTYTLALDNVTLAEETARGNTVSFAISADMIPAGTVSLALSGAFEGCTPAAMTAPLTLVHSTKPPVEVNGLTLITTATGELQWYLDGNPIPGAMANTHVAEHSGTYFVKSSVGICELNSDPVVLAVTGIEQGGKLFELYPNPASTTLTINLGATTRNTESVDIEIVNLQGMVVRKYYMRNSPDGLQLNVAGLANGLYNIVISAGNQRFEDRFLKE